MSAAFWLSVVLLGSAALVALLYAQANLNLLQYLFFARVPVLGGVLLVGAPFALAHASTRGVYDLGEAQLTLLTWLAAFAAWTVMETAGLILDAGPERFGLPFRKRGYQAVRRAERYGLDGESDHGARAPRRVRHRIFLLLAAPVIVLAARGTGEVVPAHRAAAVIAGVVVAEVLRLASGPFWQTKLKPLLQRGLLLFKPLGGLLRLFRKERAPGRRRPSVWFAALTNPFRPGYRSGRHLRAAGLLGLTLLAYVAAIVVFEPAGPVERAEWLPGLVYLLLIFMWAVWLLAAATFFLDRYRVPVMVSLVALSFVLSWTAKHDHYFPLEADTTATVERLESRDVVRRWLQTRDAEEKRVIVVVAAEGGGVSASYWAARVLTGLQGELGAGFARRIVFVSATSGAAVGSLFYVAAYEGAEGSEPSALPRILHASGASALASTTWGMAYPDFFRLLTGGALAPGGPLVDRGWALERNWEQRGRIEGVGLSDWRSDVASGRRPVLVMNATLDSGERLLISPIDLPARSVGPGKGPRCAAPAREVGSRSFREAFPGSDLELVTAARLSASFPYILPIASPWAEGSPLPGCPAVADGGYSDNQGLLTVADFLRELEPGALRGAGVRRALVLRIRTAPTSPSADIRQDRGRGWKNAVWGPSRTSLSTLWTQQRIAAEEKLAALGDEWREHGLPIHSAVFHLQREVPLIWALPPDDRMAIEDEWLGEAGTRGLAAVRAAIAPNPAER